MADEDGCAQSSSSSLSSAPSDEADIPVMESRLAVLRTDLALCDGEIVVGEQSFPVHTAIVALASPVFRAVFCGDFKEGREKKLVLTETTAEAVVVILDFAYETFQEKQLANPSFCLQVWQAAHAYQSIELRCLAAQTAMKNTSADYRVRVFEHASLYGSSTESEQGLELFADALVANSKECTDFGRLPVQLLMSALENT